MREAKRSNSRPSGQAAPKHLTARVRADSFPDRPARIASAPVRQASTSAGESPRPTARDQASIALHNLRGIAMAFVLMTHASVAYVASAPTHLLPFDRAPYGWLIIPIVDARRWLGLDLFCGWQDIYLMSFWFFLSGVFIWPSIERYGRLHFLSRRLLRLGIPLFFGVTLLMPAAFYPVYRVTAPDPSLTGYVRQYLALPFAPCGPLWFLWQLLGFTLAAAALHRFARPAVLRVGDLSRRFERRPVQTFAVWTLICAAAYVPLALLFTPWTWVHEGPFSLQLCRPLLYAAYFYAGMGVGTVGLGKGILRSDGIAARKWAIWMGAAIASVALWMGLMALTLHLGSSAPLILSVASDATYALAGACSVVFVLGIWLRFGTAHRWRTLTPFSDNAFGLYVLHYAPVVWLQYALLGLNWPAPVKAALVFCGAAASCLAVISAAGALLRAVGSLRSFQWTWGV